MLTTKEFDTGKPPLLRKPFQVESLRGAARDTLEKWRNASDPEAMPGPAGISRRQNLDMFEILPASKSAEMEAAPAERISLYQCPCPPRSGACIGAMK